MSATSDDNAGTNGGLPRLPGQGRADLRPLRAVVAAAPPLRPPGAPNVVVILVDDLGLSPISAATAARSRRRTSTRWRRQGFRYTNFHVTPLCSPTRAALMTGRNAHAAGIGLVANVDPGFPGYAVELPREPAVDRRDVPRQRLRDAHGRQVAPLQGQRPGRGRRQALVAAAAWLRPVLRVPRSAHELPPPPSHVRGQRPSSTSTSTPTATTSPTTSPTAPSDDPRAQDRPTRQAVLPLLRPRRRPRSAARQEARHRSVTRGRYDAGWDGSASERLARQMRARHRAGRHRAAAAQQRTGRDVAAWDSLSRAEQTVFARYMECYAAMVDDHRPERRRRLRADARPARRARQHHLRLPQRQRRLPRGARSTARSPYFRDASRHRRG